MNTIKVTTTNGFLAYRPLLLQPWTAVSFTVDPLDANRRLFSNGQSININTIVHNTSRFIPFDTIEDAKNYIKKITKPWIY